MHNANSVRDICFQHNTRRRRYMEITENLISFKKEENILIHTQSSRLDVITLTVDVLPLSHFSA